MGLAYEMALISLRLSDRGDIANDVVAHKIIELAKAGEHKFQNNSLADGVRRLWRDSPGPPCHSASQGVAR
jgi:hypothetical protein